MKIQIETDRLLLRDIRDSDVIGMFELDSNPKVHKYLGNEPITKIEQAKSNIASIKSQYLERGIGRFALIEKSTGAFIGWSGIKFNIGEKECLGDKKDFYDIGYRLIERFWRKGYAKESAIAVLDFGFNELKLETIVGTAETENIASNKILRKIGLQYTETFAYKNVMLHWYALNKEDYAKKMSRMRR